MGVSERLSRSGIGGQFWSVYIPTRFGGPGAARAVFEQIDVEVPKTWSQTATNVVVSKYFRGQLGTEERETSVRQLIGRVTAADDDDPIMTIVIEYAR